MKRLCLFALCLATALPVLAAEKASPVGRKIENFSLKDFRGTEHSLAEWKDSKIIVVAFLGTECPLAKLYAPRLQELATEYGPMGVTFIGIDSNRQDSLAEIADFARDHQISFPVLKDLSNKVADQLGAVRTPEVFVLDAGRTVRYWGRIDDRCGIGYIREKATENYLQSAIDRLLVDAAIETASVDSVGCFIGRVRDAKENASITYSKQISRIFQNRCVQCHREGEIAPFAMTDYNEVVGWADTIAEVVREKRMPPWHANPEYGHFRNDVSLTAEETQQILSWIENGAPEGDRAELPEPQQYISGWTLPEKPEFVIDVQETAYKVPAEGEVEYQYFVVDPGFKEAKWVKAGQILPGSAQAVHHVLCFIQPPGENRREFDENGLGFLAAYVPGYRATPFPDGMAKYVPAGSKFIFQMHYTPIGREVEDLSKMGLVFAKPEELTHMVQTISTGSRGFEIPPHADNYKAESTMGAYKHDLQVLSYAPHMHVRGKAFKYEAIYPDGKREVLLDVPKYDFNWQTSYELAEPKVLPAGTKVHCVAHWDNSENNLANPNPNATVRWGDQTWEEMMIGFYDVVVPIDREKLLADGTIPQLQPQQKTPEEQANELISQFDRNGDGKLSADELPGRFQAFFGQLDRNGDKVLETDEVVTFVKLRGAAGGGRGEGRRGRRGNRDANEGQQNRSESRGENN